MPEIITGIIDRLKSALSPPADSGNAPVLLMLGTFKFSLNTAAFQAMQRDTEYNWASIPRFENDDALQFISFGADTITLPGVIYPDWRGNSDQVSALRRIAETGRPQRLLTADGINSGYWSIIRVSDNRTNVKADGNFRKQEFTVVLRFYGYDLH